MAGEEQLSLCWSNFNSNLSAGCHESLCRGDLVDVTLAAEGQFVKAHRLVLSVCSPYFYKIFTQIPANQHAFVFLKDVSHTALKDLIQFMYCGEVNVKQQTLPAFMSAAEALQIRGLTACSKQPDQSPQRSVEPIISTGTTITTTAVIHKRSSGGGTPHTKRMKNTIDPLESEITTDGSGTAGTENITVATPSPEPKSQQINSTENVDLTMETWVKEEASDVDGGDNDGTAYAENDENYFAENEDVGPTTAVSSGTTDSVTTATTSCFDSSYAEGGDHNNSSGLKKFILSAKGGILLVHNNYIYHSSRKLYGKNKETKYWGCIHYSSKRCRSRLKIIGEKILITNDEHNHSDEESRIEKARKNNRITYQSLSEILQLQKKCICR